MAELPAVDVRAGWPRGGQRWSTFLKNRAKAILACDFFVVVIEHGRCRLAHVNVTAYPTAEWTLQQLREVNVVARLCPECAACRSNA